MTNIAPSPCILQLQKLFFAYPEQPPLFSNACATVGAGVTLLYGDTGSGKSTLLRLMAGTLQADGGQLAVAGVQPGDGLEGYRRNVFFCDPATAEFDEVTGRDCTASLRTGDTRFDEARWQALVDGFALAPHIDKPMYMLSTGSKRKVWLAAALASGRPLTLLDEPIGGLDAASSRCLWRALAELAPRPDRAIVVASTMRIDQVPLAGTIELPLR